jgi:hypothetical protein
MNRGDPAGANLPGQRELDAVSWHVGEELPDRSTTEDGERSVSEQSAVFAAAGKFEVVKCTIIRTDP